MTSPKLKSFEFEGSKFQLLSPEQMKFKNKFYSDLYSKFYDEIVDGNCFPQINCDNLTFDQSGNDYYQLGIDEGIKLQMPSPKSSNAQKEKVQIAIQELCREYPLLVTFIQNCRLKADIAIKHAESLIQQECNINNFIKLKQVIGQFNKLNWNREMDKSETQASVSNLGTISENLLNLAFGKITDEKSFFKVTSSRVNSYGDFVLMCLPNNLWLSVKSNFARERLLASGYSNDILAVGFFEDYKEFTSQVRIRNMQRAGFLCIYIPDVAVTVEQNNSNTNTYEQTLEHYKKNKFKLPLNINGTDFIRPLSNISSDLEKLLNEKNIERRLSVDF